MIFNINSTRGHTGSLLVISYAYCLMFFCMTAIQKISFTVELVLSPPICLCVHVYKQHKHIIYERARMFHGFKCLLKLYSIKLGFHIRGKRKRHAAAACGCGMRYANDLIPYIRLPMRLHSLFLSE